MQVKRFVLAVLICLGASSWALAQEPLLQVEGSLSKLDRRLEDGSPYDEYVITLNAGEGVSIEMNSLNFDSFLVVHGPAGEYYENDDFGGSQRRSRIELVAPTAGEYRIQATCFDPGERGSYTLTVDRIEAFRGELAEGDQVLEQGTFVDWYEIDCPAGQMLTLQVTSQEFDTWLILEDPLELWEQNDDWDNSTNISRIESNTFVGGTYRVGVTSYQQGETGSYELTISRGPGFMPTMVDGPQTLAAAFDGTEIELGGNGFAHGYAFEAEAGSTVIIDMSSENLDTFLKIKGPGGLVEENDDVQGSTDSRLAFRAEASGTYYVTATTYHSGRTGAYTIKFDLNASKYDAGDWAVDERGRVFGVFVGIAEYAESDKLPYCDEDARRLSNAFQRHFDVAPSGTILLVNEEATVQAVEQAIQDVVRKAGPHDMIVFFYSGHGDQRANDGADPYDPDGFDETLSVYDGHILDDRFAELFDSCRARTVLLVIDSCYSGGFAADFITRPGRVGLFSSEGDCLSMTAEELKSGGYLSRFFLDAITSHRDEADLNSDRMLTIHELTYYIQTRFAEVLEHRRRGNPSRLYPSGAIDPTKNFAYQRVICNRDGVSPHLILMDW